MSGIVKTSLKDRASFLVQFRVYGSALRTAKGRTYPKTVA